MELLDRYLQAVGKNLPWKKRNDILAELREDLEAQLADREAELGRPLTQGESEDWLRQLGSPVQRAASYGPQQYVIGPGIFPFYSYVLRIACLWAALIYCVVNLALFLTHQLPPSTDQIAATLIRLPFVLLQVLAWVTLGFASFEYLAAHYPDKCPPVGQLWSKWSPSELPPLEKPTTAAKRCTYAQAVAEVIFGFLVLVWGLLIPAHPFLVFGPSAPFLVSTFRLTQVCLVFYWAVLGLYAAQLLLNCIALFRGVWQQKRWWPHLAMKTLGLVPLFWLASAPGATYILLRHPETDGPRFAAQIGPINGYIHLGLELICAITLLQLLWEVSKATMEKWSRPGVMR